MTLVNNEWHKKANDFANNEEFQKIADGFKTKIIDSQDNDNWLRIKLGILYAPIMNDIFNTDYSLEDYNELGLNIDPSNAIVVAVGFILEEENNGYKNYGDPEVIECLNYLYLEDKEMQFKRYFDNEILEQEIDITTDNIDLDNVESLLNELNTNKNLTFKEKRVLQKKIIELRGKKTQMDGAKVDDDLTKIDKDRDTVNCSQAYELRVLLDKGYSQEAIDYCCNKDLGNNDRFDFTKCLQLYKREDSIKAKYSDEIINVCCEIDLGKNPRDGFIECLEYYK
jgi:hypothetical protein